MKSPRLVALLPCVILLSTAARADAAPGGYNGLGLESIDAKTLEKYAPPALPPQLSRKIQGMLDVRAPAPGIVHPDGKRLFFSWTVTGVRQIWRVDGPLRFPVQMTGGEDPTQLAAISPDGKWLVVSRDRNGEENPGLYLQSVDGGPLKVVQHKAKVQTHFETMSLDSRWLYFSANDVKPESFAIYRYNMETGDKQLLFSQDGTWSVGDLLPSGKLLLRKETGNIAREFYEWDSDVQALTPVVGQGEKEQYEVAYSAKPGEFLVLTPKFGDFKRLYRFKGGKYEPLTPELSADVSEFLDRRRPQACALPGQ